MPVPTLSTRLARVEDARDLETLWKLCWGFTYRGVIPEKALEKLGAVRSDAWFVSAIEKGNRIRLVTFGNDIIGFSTYGRNRATGLNRGDGKDGEIYEIYVNPTYHGIGAGKLLLTDSLTDLADHDLDRTLIWFIADIRDNNPLLGYCKTLVAWSAEEFGDKMLQKVCYEISSNRQRSHAETGHWIENSKGKIAQPASTRALEAALKDAFYRNRTGLYDMMGSLHHAANPDDDQKPMNKSKSLYDIENWIGFAVERILGVPAPSEFLTLLVQNLDKSFEECLDMDLPETITKVKVYSDEQADRILRDMNDGTDAAFKVEDLPPATIAITGLRWRDAFSTLNSAAEVLNDRLDLAIYDVRVTNEYIQILSQ